MTEAKNLHQRLAAVMAVVTYVQKEKKKEMNYSIVSHDAVTAKVRPALLEHGVIYYPIRCEHSHNGNRAECSLTMRFANVDDPADHIDVQTFGYGVDGQDKGPGKAMSYAVKYALLKTLGLETGDDADTDNLDYSREDPHIPSRNSAIDLALDVIATASDLAALGSAWKLLDRDVQANARVMAAKDARKAELTPKPQDEAPF